MKKPQNDSDLQQVQLLEEKLRLTYGAVKPAPEFIETLQQRLITPPKVFLENRRNGLVLLISAIGLVLGVVLFILIRAIYHLFAEDDHTN